MRASVCVYYFGLAVFALYGGWCCLYKPVEHGTHEKLFATSKELCAVFLTAISHSSVFVYATCHTPTQQHTHHTHTLRRVAWAIFTHYITHLPYNFAACLCWQSITAAAAPAMSIDRDLSHKHTHTHMLLPALRERVYIITMYVCVCLSMSLFVCVWIFLARAQHQLP